MDDLVGLLRLLGNFGHDNHSMVHDAADAIECLTAERDALVAERDAAAAAVLAERERWEHVLKAIRTMILLGATHHQVTDAIEAAIRAEPKVSHDV